MVLARHHFTFKECFANRLPERAVFGQLSRIDFALLFHRVDRFADLLEDWYPPLLVCVQSDALHI